jgi:hypothetical protein
MKLSPQDVESLKDSSAAGGEGWGGFSYVNDNNGGKMEMEIL